MIARACGGRVNASTASQNAYVPVTTGLEKGALLVTRPAGPDPWDQAIDELLAIRLLEDDWDGQGAKAPSVELVDSAILLAQAGRQRGYAAPSRVVPGINGSVIFEWQDGGIYEEVEVLRPFYAERIRMAPGQEAVQRIVVE